jgi:hypothetical protein
VRLTTYPVGTYWNACDEPTDIAPDGRRFVFLRSRLENGPAPNFRAEQVAMFVENLDGTGPRLLQPAVSPSRTSSPRPVGHRTARTSSLRPPTARSSSSTLMAWA